MNTRNTTTSTPLDTCLLIVNINMGLISIMLTLWGPCGSPNVLIVYNGRHEGSREEPALLEALFPRQKHIAIFGIGSTKVDTEPTKYEREELLKHKTIESRRLLSEIANEPNRETATAIRLRSSRDYGELGSVTLQ